MIFQKELHFLQLFDSCVSVCVCVCVCVCAHTDIQGKIFLNDLLKYINI